MNFEDDSTPPGRSSRRELLAGIGVFTVLGIVWWFIVARVLGDYSWAGEGIWLILSIPLIGWGVGILLWAIASTGLFGWLHRYFHG